ncbi:MAG: gamma-glutamyl-gamma-aminobutyrate hydrolase family protein [Anaerolinea sp.]|nr:gamma-glutamyl-gamma-aminobutyrate hydrolase family protein [Anaerolinea sp.]
MRPLIGISTSDVYAERGKLYHRAYALNAHAIADAGGLPVYIPTGLETSLLRELYERLDAVLLPGGPDVDPVEYGQERHPKTKIIDVPRDALELTLARWAAEDDLPMFGICRGHQVMNVAFGGTLVQDIPSQVETTLTHDLPDEYPRDTRLHEVQVDPGSRLASILGTTQVTVNSLHHQSVQQPGPGVAVTAYAPDGVVEALELPDKRFVLSVQWHPEDLYENDDMMRRLFQEFVSAARDTHRRI